MIDIFRKRDATAVGRYFGASFIQHDPTLADGVAGMTSIATEIASSPTADITIYRTLVDGNFVLLHSKYQGDGRYRGPAISFDLFRFDGGKIVEHWGGQEPEAPPNLSGRTQVDGPTVVLDREKTEANRTLVRAYRQTVMVDLRFDRIQEFIEESHYAQHASKIGDGIARLRDRIASVAKEGGSCTSRHAASWLRVTSFLCSRRRSPDRTHRALRPVSGRERKNSRTLGCPDANPAAGPAEKPKRPILGVPKSRLGAQEDQVATQFRIN